MYKTTAVALAALVALAGCITLPEDGLDRTDADATQTMPLPPTTRGNMSAEETAEESSGACIERGGIDLPGILMRCAHRVTTVSGKMDLDSLPVSLTTSFTDVAVVAGEEGAWSLVLDVTARSATDEEARAQADDITLEWTHETALGYALEAHVETARDSFNDVESMLTLTVPPSLLVGLTVGSSSGDVGVGGVKLRGAGIATSSGDVVVSQSVSDSLFVSTSSGDIGLGKVEVDALVVESSSGDAVLDDVEADTFRGGSSSGDFGVYLYAKLVEISTSSGDIMGTLVPVGASTFTLGATSGDVGIGLPTGKTYGYDIVATTTSGEVSIDLPDGEPRCDEDNEECTFTTSGFASRANRGVLTISTSSGDISAESSNLA